MTPIQVFQFSNIMGFYLDADKRLIRDALLFVPRKFSKTTSVASLAIWDMLFGDSNAQAYTAANSYEQAQICFKEVKKVPDDFSCDNTEPFIKVKRLRIIDGEPDVLDVDYISTKYVKEISPSVAEHSLYDYFENDLGLKISYAVKDVSVQTVSEELAKMLELDPDRKAVLVKSMVYLEDTSLFQLTASYHNPNRFRFIDFARRSKI